jgi:hypothetical protein
MRAFFGIRRCRRGWDLRSRVHWWGSVLHSIGGPRLSPTSAELDTQGLRYSALLESIKKMSTYFRWYGSLVAEGFYDLGCPNFVFSVPHFKRSAYRIRCTCLVLNRFKIPSLLGGTTSPTSFSISRFKSAL